MTAPAAPPARKPLLDLETLDPAERPFVTIDKVEYDLAVPGDFTLLEYHRIEKLAGRIGELRALTAELADDDELRDSHTRMLSSILDDEVALVLRAPADVRSRLSDVQKLVVVEAFGQASRRASAPSPKPNRATRRATPRTGEKSSRGSAATTPGRTS
jgi:hypothetical protein